MHRFYVEDCPGVNGIVSLSQEDAHHALRVLRMREGAEAEIISGGVRYRAEMVSCVGSAVSFILKEPLPSTEARLRITLFQGISKADRMDYTIQKAAEIGIARIVPVHLSRCVVRLNACDADKKLERWRRIAREAGKQSGRCLIPDVTSPVNLSDVVTMARSLDACAVPWEETNDFGPRSFLARHPAIQTLGILIGPEGGIEPSEILELSDAFSPITLGPRILRTETAGIVAAAAFLAISGEMEAWP